MKEQLYNQDPETYPSSLNFPTLKIHKIIYRYDYTFITNNSLAHNQMVFSELNMLIYIIYVYIINLNQ